MISSSLETQLIATNEQRIKMNKNMSKEAGLLITIVKQKMLQSAPNSANIYINI